MSALQAEILSGAGLLFTVSLSAPKKALVAGEQPLQTQGLPFLDFLMPDGSLAAEEVYLRIIEY